MTTLFYFLFLSFNVRGVVSDPSGRPVEGAQVACGTGNHQPLTRTEISNSAQPATPPSPKPASRRKRSR